MLEWINAMLKKMTMCKKDYRPPNQKSWLCIASKLVVLSLDIWLSSKAFKRLLQSISLMLDLLYHKRNPFITTVADDSNFLKKYLRLLLERKTLEKIFIQVL